MFQFGHPRSNQLAAFGEFMMRLHCKDDRRFQQAGSYQAYYAGAEANASVMLSRLGVPVRYITRLPDSDLARAGVTELMGQGVDTSHIVYGGDKLGLYFTEQGNGIRATRVLYDREGSSYARLLPGMIDWSACLSGISYFHWSGIAAAVSQGAADVCAEAIAEAGRQGAIISTDFNYRSTLWKYGRHPREVMPGLLERTKIAVADLDSASVYFGIKTDPHADFQERFRQCSRALQQYLPDLEVLGMSFRTTRGIQHTYSGALLYKGEYWFSAAHELPFVTDQIGTGDAFTGGLLFGLMNGMEPGRIVDFATACGALKQSIVGDWAIISREEVEAFIHRGPSGRIFR